MASALRLIDSHTHLQETVFDRDRADLMARAAAAGVAAFVCNGSSEADWPRVGELARLDRRIIPCFGLHPWYVQSRSPRWLDELRRWLDAMPSAVGEVGLDRWLENRDEPAMEAAFRAQLSIARDRGLPVMVHCLRAWGWLMDVLADEPPLPAGMLIHAYGGSPELIGPLAQRGGYFSFAGNTFEPRRIKARHALSAVPRDKLLIETDAPDMLPPAGIRRGSIRDEGDVERNVPENLTGVYHAVAAHLAEDPATLATDLWANARRLLGGLMDHA